VEAVVKKPAFGCQMCGQCVLHDTGMTCPMGCPKQMRNGPCGGLGPNGECEVDPTMTCVWLKAYRRDARSPFRGHVHNLLPPVDWRLQGTSSWLNLLTGADQRAAILAPTIPAPAAEPYTDGRFERALRARERFVVVSEVNPPDGADLTALRALGRAMAEFADVVSVTEHGAARNHLSSVPAAIALEQEGVETIATFTCRDRNRIALQGDLLGASALGVRNVLLVTGNHPVVGDHPNAKPVFDLDSINLLRTARRLRDEGVFESGRALTETPKLFLGAACAPFAEPRDERPGRVAKKVAAGADFVISQHVFEPDVFRRFVSGVAARGLLDRLHVLGAVAVLPDVSVAERLNRVLTGFTIPTAIVTRLRQARDPQDTGIEIAAELLAEICGIEGVRGSLIAALGGGSGASGHAMGGSDLADAEIQREVLRRAGLLRAAHA
jgi:5,10-methylenetetrahydrofolate reductase